MENRYRMNYDVDLVLCLDITMGMHGAMDIARIMAQNFCQDFASVMERKRKRVGSLRVRVIAFRDYLYDREMAMTASDFFSLPEQNEAFRAWIGALRLDGGGDDPEDGLEALAYAIKSDWNHEGAKRRHVIVALSDDATHELGFGKSVPNYPKDMPRDFEELSAWWGSRTNPGVMDENAKRLIIFAPNKASWNTISDNWNNVIQYESEAGQGLQDCDYEQILSAICNSI